MFIETKNGLVSTNSVLTRFKKELAAQYKAAFESQD
jgi:hypothetical protein